MGMGFCGYGCGFLWVGKLITETHGWVTSKLYCIHVYTTFVYYNQLIHDMEKITHTTGYLGNQKRVKTLKVSACACFQQLWKELVLCWLEKTEVNAVSNSHQNPPNPWLGYGFCWGTESLTHTHTPEKPMVLPSSRKRAGSKSEDGGTYGSWQEIQSKYIKLLLQNTNLTWQEIQRG